METRTFLAGVSIGLIIGALAAISFRPERATCGDGDRTQAGTPLEPRADSRKPSADAAPVRAAAPSSPRPGSGDVSRPQARARGHVAAAHDPSQDPDAEFLEGFADRWEEAPNGAELTKRLKTEPRDDAWASYMETQLRDFLARRPVPNALGTISVHCAATVCRLVSAVHHQIWAGVPNTDLQAAMNEMPNESLGRELTFVMASFGEHPKDSTMIVIVVFLKRAEEPREPSP